MWKWRRQVFDNDRHYLRNFSNHFYSLIVHLYVVWLSQDFSIFTHLTWLDFPVISSTAYWTETISQLIDIQLTLTHMCYLTYSYHCRSYYGFTFQYTHTFTSEPCCRDILFLLSFHSSFLCRLVLISHHTIIKMIIPHLLQFSRCSLKFKSRILFEFK